MKKTILLFLFINSNILFANTDSLFVNNDKKYNIAIITIKGWQKISKNTSLINCQFSPSCSEYGIIAIKKKGTIRGILYSADRVARCNPFAYKYYSRNEKGKLINPLEKGAYYKSKNIPYIAIPISFIIPGFDKMVNGRFYDGISFFGVIGVSAYCMVKSYDNDNIFKIPITLAFTFFYWSDIYFNYLSINKGD